MDNKKLIGMVIGVTAFVVLIAAATYAWFTYSINFLNNTANFVSKNFSVVYDKGTAIDKVPTFVSTPTITDFNATTGGNINVTAKTVSNSLDGLFNLYLFINTTDPYTQSSATIINKGIIKWAVCVDSETIDNATYTGTINNSTDLTSITESSSEVAKRLTLVSNRPIDTTQHTYHVYIWLDAAAIDADTAGLSFSGYIGASATQLTD